MSCKLHRFSPLLNARKTSDGPRDLEKSPSLERSGEGRGRAAEGRGPVICPQATLTKDKGPVS